MHWLCTYTHVSVLLSCYGDYLCDVLPYNLYVRWVGLGGYGVCSILLPLYTSDEWDGGWAYSSVLEVS